MGVNRHLTISVTFSPNSDKLVVFPIKKKKKKKVMIYTFFAKLKRTTEAKYHARAIYTLFTTS